MNKKYIPRVRVGFSACVLCLLLCATFLATDCAASALDGNGNPLPTVETTASSDLDLSEAAQENEILPPSEDPEGILPQTEQIPQIRTIEYTVPERAELEVIAGYYGVSPEEILFFNNIDAIHPGDTILIPNPITEVPYTPPMLYTVKKGDCLGVIAETFDVTIKSLRQWNGLTEKSVFQPGMVLTIPVLYKAPQVEETLPQQTEPMEDPGEEPWETEPVEDETGYVCDVPLYFQNDYPDTLYGDGTVANNGCSVASLAMVANAITGYDYAVDELAEYFGGCALNNIARLETGSKALGLSFRKTENWNETWKAIQDGKIAIVLMDGISGGCLFTDSQHFIVVTGLNDQGRIMVHDSNRGNYDLWNLKNGFENGFEPKDILYGYSGAWVYDRTLEEIPARYTRPRLIKSEENKKYPEITLTREERELLARVIWAEARGECDEGQQAIAEVVFNRMLSDQFSDTLEGVIYGQGQFRSVPYLEKAEPGQAQYQAIDRAMYGTPVLNRNILYFATTPTNQKIYIQIGNHIFCY